MSDLSDYKPFEDSGSEYMSSGSDSDNESDDSLSSISDKEDQAATSIGDFIVVADPFSDKRATPTVPFSSLYEGFHPAIELEEMNDPVNCFGAFLSRNIIQILCNWTNERAGKLLIENASQKVYDLV
ncbi:unnamed protein product [Psylliodes chrysocephalus]|uniref:Uncharacterized protein n=1 Tax=Psylliodes chrysocephalus TaxID=3402493 RepID=A0A9P0D0Y5_9CUCU|nr:unnamed protein product [Psylliodes chrysocephala]